VTPKI